MDQELLRDIRQARTSLHQRTSHPQIITSHSLNNSKQTAEGALTEEDEDEGLTISLQMDATIPAIEQKSGHTECLLKSSTRNYTSMPSDKDDFFLQGLLPKLKKLPLDIEPFIKFDIHC